MQLRLLSRVHSTHDDLALHDRRAEGSGVGGDLLDEVRVVVGKVGLDLGDAVKPANRHDLNIDRSLAELKRLVDRIDLTGGSLENGHSRFVACLGVAHVEIIHDDRAVEAEVPPHVRQVAGVGVVVDDEHDVQVFSLILAGDGTDDLDLLDAGQGGQRHENLSHASDGNRSSLLVHDESLRCAARRFLADVYIIPLKYVNVNSICMKTQRSLWYNQKRHESTVIKEGKVSSCKDRDG